MTAAPQQDRDWTALFDPRAIAVVGASADPAKWGYAVAVQALRGADRHHVHLVNRRGGAVAGVPCLRTLDDVPEPLDLAVLAVPAPAVEDAVAGALARGAKALVLITAGLGETGPAGRAREAAMVERVRDAGAVLLGPNCLGLVDNHTGTYVSSNAFTAGDVALLSQSGNLAIEIDRLLTARGLGISRFVSLGNQADLTLAELLRACAGDAGTRAIAVYAEDVRDGRAFLDAAVAAGAAGRPVVLLAAGASAAATRGAQSHTGALTTDAAVLEAACAAAGIALARTPRQLVEILVALRAPSRPRGRRTAVLTDGGGHGVVAADVAVALGLDVPPLAPDTRAALQAALGPRAGVANPVDLAGAGEQDPLSYARAFAALQGAAEIDAVLLTGYFGGYSSGADGLTGLGPAECAAAKQLAADAAGGKPVVVHSIFPEAPACTVLRDSGIPVYGAVEDAALALAALTPPARPARIRPLPAPAPPLGGTDYLAARDALAAAGIPFAAARGATTAAEVSAAARELRPPYVLKALGTLHKSDAGGVVVGLPDEAALLAAHADMVARLASPACSVEEQADVRAGIELIIGVRRDPRFGPVVLVGIGGVAAEALRDVRVALGPVDAAAALGLLRTLRGAALLGPYRGRPALAVEQAADAIARLSAFAAAHPELAEVEINPLLVTPSAAIGLDARIVASAARS